MISTSPKHKGAENLRAQLNLRYKKLKEQIEKSKKTKKGKSSKNTIKKEGIQVALIGLTNSGKSSLLKKLTNAFPRIDSYDFTTKSPLVGALMHEGISFQIIDLPAVNYETFDTGIANSADILLLIINSIEQIKQLEQSIKNAKGKRIIVFNKADLLNESEKRKISATLKSKRYNYVIISATTNENINELKQKLLESSGMIRVYTKNPNKKQADEKPVILLPNSTVKDLAEKILHGFSKNIKESRIWGPSSKFSNQIVGLTHVLKDKDIVEFKTR